MDTEIARLKRNWGWLVALGILLIILGLLALGSLVFTTLLSLVFFGWILVIAGIAQLIQLFWARDSGSFLAHLVSGLLALVVGLLIVFNPGVGAVVVTFLLSIFFIVSGLVRFLTALASRRTNWGWSALYGVVVFLLGILIFVDLPVSGLVLIGLFIGIELLLNGLSWLALGLAARNYRE
jgi:uncharacterized membrane protein HdeD (DUF308 family)